DDGPLQVDWMVSKLSTLRIFEDQNGKMNRSLLDVDGDALVVSQFTLMGDCRKGRRPAFTGAAPPEIAVPIYESFCQKFGQCTTEQGRAVRVETGRFGADMQVSLVNDGPVTLIVETPDVARALPTGQSTTRNGD
ncbi:MAG: D-aminoacyl-tRNA deacylase, partial [Planctomycetota bacterium]